MPTKSSSPVPAIEPVSERALEAPELIERMAMELRTTSGSNLPLEFYIDQVKRRLAGQETNDVEATSEKPQRAAAGTPQSVFHSWAMPDS